MRAGDKRPNRITIHDVARQAGVGVGTVSRVLNAQPGVNEDTRRRVGAVIAELAYRPDLAARSLRRGRTGTVGAIVPFFTKQLYVEILRAVTRATATMELSLVVFDVERPEEYERAIHQWLSRGLVDGLLLVSITPTDDQVSRLAEAGLELVLIDAFHPQVPSVDVDHARGAVAAVSHLLDLGHSRIGLIDRPSDPFATSGFGPRLDGYGQAHAEAGIAVDNRLLTSGDYSRESGHVAMERLLALRQPPTAVFAASDLQAIGAMETIRAADRLVPDDIAVVGYNDIELAEYVGLTTIRLPTVEMGDVALGLLGEALAGKATSSQHVRFTGKLVARRTSGGYTG
ncbi:MAG: LacI family DNA-binding transcriptional regulator [Chloroflexota bacterium]